MNSFVLDASAILALMLSEPGKERVEEILDDSVVARINATEVLTKLVERGTTLREAIDNFNDLGLFVTEFDEEQSQTVATLRPVTKHLGLSLGDRACLALAMQENATAVTADRNWSTLSVCSIESIR